MSAGDVVEETLRDRRRRLVRQDIERIAVRMFLDRGYENVSVDDIALAVGMSGRTFFRYYASKDEILRRFQHSLNDALADVYRAQLESISAFAALRAAYVATAHVDESERAHIRALGRLLASTPAVHARAVGELLTDNRVASEYARRSHAGSGDVRPEIMAAAAAAAAHVAWSRWVTGDDPRDPAVAVAAALDMLGLGH